MKRADVIVCVAVTVCAMLTGFNGYAGAALAGIAVAWMMVRR